MAKGFGISITTKFKKGEWPLASAVRLVSKDQRIGKLRYFHGLNLLIKNKKLSNPSITKVIC